MRRASKQKIHSSARDHERAAARIMSEALDREVLRRVIGEEAQNTADEDTVVGRDLRGCEPYAVQCKHGVRPNIHAAIEEAEYACRGPWKVPIAITRRVGSGTELVTMRAADFVKLMRHGAIKPRKPKGDELPQGVSLDLVPFEHSGEFPIEVDGTVKLFDDVGGESGEEFDVAYWPDKNDIPL